MKNFKNILFVADSAPNLNSGLLKAMELAALNKAKLTLIDVVDDFSHVLSDLFNVGAAQKDVIKEREKELKKLVNSLKKKHKSVNPKIIVTEGKNFIQIINYVKKNNIDLVVKVASGDFKLTGTLISSLGMHLIRKCPCPVLIMKPRRKIFHSKILTTVDLIPPPKGKKDLNDTLLEIASSLAEVDQGELHVLHSWYLPNENRLKNSQVEAFETVASMVKELRQMQKKRMEGLLEKYETYDPQTHLIKGQPETVIPRFIKNHGIDLVVMGTIARSGIAGFFIGNTAEKILSSVNCSVLTVKPEGFKTPV